jgi:hypothetical protein
MIAREERSGAGRHERRRGVKVWHLEEPGTTRSTNKVRGMKYLSPSQARFLCGAGGGGQAGEVRNGCERDEGARARQKEALRERGRRKRFSPKFKANRLVLSSVERSVGDFLHSGNALVT